MSEAVIEKLRRLVQFGEAQGEVDDATVPMTLGTARELLAILDPPVVEGGITDPYIIYTGEIGIRIGDISQLNECLQEKDDRPVPAEWGWYYSFDGGELYKEGPFASKEEAEAEAEAEAVADGQGEYQKADYERTKEKKG